MNRKGSSKLNALFAFVVSLAVKLPENGIALMRRSMGLVRAARSMGVRVHVAVQRFEGSAWGQRWRSGRGHNHLIVAIVGLFLITIFAAYLIGPAIGFIFGVSTSTWNSGTAALWGVVGIVIALSTILIVISTTGML